MSRDPPRGARGRPPFPFLRAAGFWESFPEFHVSPPGTWTGTRKGKFPETPSDRPGEPFKASYSPFKFGAKNIKNKKILATILKNRPPGVHRDSYFYAVPFVRIWEFRCRSLQKRNLERSAPQFPESDQRGAIKMHFEGGRILRKIPKNSRFPRRGHRPASWRGSFQRPCQISD